LLSDDAYLLGFILGFPIAGLAFIYSVSDSIPRLKRWKHLIVCISLVAWCTYLIATDEISKGEGYGWGYFFAKWSFIAGIIGWLLCLIRLPKQAQIIISGICILLIIAFIFAAINMKTHLF
jgi:peptidoglycan/LPS O-acetylase OafA/YrhL